MRKLSLLLIVLLIISSCGVKQAQSQLNEGNYDDAIAIAVDGLRNNKDKKGKQDYVYLLEEAFAKAKERDLNDVKLWAKEASPANLEKIYNTYLQLNERQEKIRPLLPLKLIKENREAKFPFDDYSDQIVSSKSALSKYLYDNALLLLKVNDKMVVRRAYDDLVYLDQISPGFKDVKKYMDEAKFKGTDFVSVHTKNETNMVIPTDLQRDLLDFSTYGLNDKWTAYHSTKQKNIVYDYDMVINFRQINISPEQVKEKEFVKEKQIKVGMKKLLDRNGHVVRDSLGHAVMVDNMKDVKATIYEFRQFKACQVTAKVDCTNLKTNQLVSTFPLASEFVFENIYADYKGDKRAADENYYANFDRQAIPFPSNEQMVYDTGEDLKAKLKDIIARNKFR